MKEFKTIHSFLLSQQEGQIILTAQEYPWSVLQVIPTTPDNFIRTVEALEERGFYPDTNYSDRTFCIIHLASGDYDGKHPERAIAVTQDNYEQIIEDLEDTMAQAAVWYETNIKNL